MSGEGRDPLGKRALFWMPVDERVGAPVGGGGPEPTGFRGREEPGERARAAGKHALYSQATPAAGPPGARSAVSESDPLPARGPVAVACSSCGDVRRVGLLRFAALHVPFAAWVPGRRYDRWMVCPSCRRRTWVSVTLSW